MQRNIFQRTENEQFDLNKQFIKKLNETGCIRYDCFYQEHCVLNFFV